jgi:hypothetical protein
VEHGHRKIKREAGRFWRNVVKKVQVTYMTGKGAGTLWEEKKDGWKNHFTHDFSPKLRELKQTLLIYPCHAFLYGKNAYQLMYCTSC